MDENFIIVTLALQILFESNFSSPKKRIQVCKALTRHCKGSPMSLQIALALVDISKTNSSLQSKEKKCNKNPVVLIKPLQTSSQNKSDVIFLVNHQIMTIR